MEKQNVEGTGVPEGLSRTQCEYTECVLFSKACEAKFSQYSTTDWSSKSCTATDVSRRNEARKGNGGALHKYTFSAPRVPPSTIR